MVFFKHLKLQVLLLLLLCSDWAWAETRVALIIGNANYSNSPSLANPANDANAVTKKLKSLGFKTHKHINLTSDGLRKALRDFARDLQGSDVGLFFYAGHGVQVKDQNYLAGVDAALTSESDLLFETLRVNDVLQVMESNAKTRLLFLDACRDNPMSLRLSASRSAGVGRGLARVNADKGTLIAYATAPGQIARDGQGKNSPFTKALIEHIDTPGLDVALMLRKVRNSVVEATNGQQVPWNTESLIDSFVFSAPDTEPAPRLDPELVFWQSIAQSQSCMDYQAYLETYPNGQFARLAEARRKAYCLVLEVQIAESPLEPCNDLLEAQRFTGNKGENAWQCYAQLLTSGPHSSGAKAGLKNVENQLLDGFYMSVIDQKAEQAKAWLDQFVSVNSKHLSVKTMRNELNDLKKQLAHESRLNQQAEKRLKEKQRLAEESRKEKERLAEEGRKEQERLAAESRKEQERLVEQDLDDIKLSPSGNPLDGTWNGLMHCTENKPGDYGPFSRYVSLKVEGKRVTLSGDYTLNQGTQIGKLIVRGDPSKNIPKIKIAGNHSHVDGWVLRFRYTGEYGDKILLKGNRGSRRCKIKLARN